MATKKSAVKTVVASETKKAAPAKAAAPSQPAATDKNDVAKPAAKPTATAPVKKAAAVKPDPKKAPQPEAKPKEAAKPTAAKPAPKPAAKPAATKAPAPAPKPKATVKKEEEPIPQLTPEQKLVSVPPPPPKKKTEPVKPAKVEIPEISTKTVRKYEPSFTKSVLDQPETMEQTHTMRYSEVDLQEFRELINRKLEQSKKELNYLQGLITRKDDMGGDETENRYMTMEDGSVSMEREQLAQMASRQISYMDHLEKALMRIENKTYGICRVTGKLIDKARLRAVPHATLSIEAKQMQKK